MKKLIMCQGLPGSGKTTWAIEQQTLGTNFGFVVRVNKDDIRTDLETNHGWKWSRKGEEHVIHVRNTHIEGAFAHGASIVISDDTNLDRKHRTRLAELAQECGATFEVKKFTAGVDECIRRDAQRTGKACVGAKVIRDMAKRYHWPPQVPDYSQLVPVVYTGDLQKAIICDLDGTLALKADRNIYDYSKCDLDTPNRAVLEIIKAFHARFATIIYLTGREASYRQQTETFLWRKQHYCPPGPLHMRPTGDHRKDWIVKSELFDAYVRGKYDVSFVLDDRNQVVNMWRAMGLTCLQVAPGDF